MMEQLFRTVLHMSLVSVYVILCVLTIRQLMKKAPKLFSYLLWSVVFLRLICPISIESSLSLVPRQVTVNTMETMANTNAKGTVSHANAARPDSDTRYEEGTQKIAVSKEKPSILSILSYLWLGGVIILTGYNLLMVIRLKDKLRTVKPIGKNFYESLWMETPFVFGILKPRIYIPFGLSEEERNYITRHEEIHIKRKDNIIKAAAFFITCVHWFNPLAWISFILMSRDMEMSCDEKVIKEFGNQIKKDYSKSLLSLAASNRMVMSGIPLSFGQNSVKSRVKNILRYKKPTLIAFIGSLAVVVIVFFGMSVNPQAADKNGFKNKKQPVALKNYVISDNKVKLKDGTKANVKLVMTKGQYYDAEYAGYGGGTYDENYSGNYELMIYKGGKKISTLAIGKWNFGGSFSLVFKDYNKDGNMDFTLGEWGSSSANLYTVFTLDDSKNVEQISSRDLITASEKEFSILLNSDDKGNIITKAYNNATGGYNTMNYKWNPNYFMYEFSKENLVVDENAQNTDSESERSEEDFLARLHSITKEDLKSAKRISEKGWETGLIRMAELKEEDISMYGYNAEKYQWRGIIIQFQDTLNYFDWIYASPDMTEPQLNYYDYDKDGKKELAVAYYLGGGTGIFVTDFYMLEQQEDKSLTAFPYSREEYAKELDKRISYKINNKKKTIALYDGKKKLREADISWLDGAAVKSIHFGNIVRFHPGKEIIMEIGAGMQVNDWASLQYADMEDLIVTIEYRDGRFRIKDIK